MITTILITALSTTTVITSTIAKHLTKKIIEKFEKQKIIIYSINKIKVKNFINTIYNKNEKGGNFYERYKNGLKDIVLFL